METRHTMAAGSWRAPRTARVERPAVVRRILCAVDFSTSARATMARATALAAATGAELTALAVLPYTFGSAPGKLAGNPVAPDPQEVARAAGALSVLLLPARAAGVPVALRVTSGEAAGQIVAQAAELGADLVVMGTHGRSGFQKVVIGSVAAAVLRQAPCPVLTLSRAVARAGSPAFTDRARILCALDLRHPAPAAISYVIALARSLDAAVTFFHVLESHALPSGRAALAADARRRLHAAVWEHQVPGCPIEERVVDGRPAIEIVRRAASLPAALVVLAEPGAGRVAAHVMRNATAPVLTFRPLQEDP